MSIKRIDIIKKNFFYTSCVVVLLMLINPYIIYSMSSVQQKSEETVALRITSTPTPNMIPIFVILDQGLLAMDGIDLEYIPSKDIRDVMVHLIKEDVDLGSFSVPSGVDMFHKGLGNIRLIGVHIWKAIYIIASKNISGWEEIRGERILIPFRGGEPDIITRASIKSMGFNPDEDFRIEYLSVANIMRLILSEQAKIAVLPEPYVSQIANQSSGKSLVVINLQQEFSGKVHRLAGGKFPLGGLWAVSSKIQHKEKAVQKFMTCFEGASQYAMDHPEETAKATCEKFREYFHSEFPESAVFEALKSGRLEFNFVRSKDMDLNAFLDEIEYPLVNDDIFYNP